MKKLAAAATAIAFLATPTFAADMAVKAPAPAPTMSAPYSWTGFYVGGNIGYGGAEKTTDYSTTLPNSALFTVLPFSQEIPSLQGFLGGGQVGFNYEMGQFVGGIEADFQGTDWRSNSTLSGLTSTAGVVHPEWTNLDHRHLKWFGTARARLGWLPTDTLLLYVTGGLMYAEVETDSLTSFPPAVFYYGAASNRRNGWTIGDGVEWMFTPHWSAKFEGLYYQLAGQNYIALPSVPALVGTFSIAHATGDLKGAIVRAGLNYHF